MPTIKSRQAQLAEIRREGLKCLRRQDFVGYSALMARETVIFADLMARLKRKRPEGQAKRAKQAKKKRAR